MSNFRTLLMNAVLNCSDLPFSSVDDLMAKQGEFEHEAEKDVLMGQALLQWKNKLPPILENPDLNFHDRLHHMLSTPEIFAEFSDMSPIMSAMKKSYNQLNVRDFIASTSANWDNAEASRRAAEIIPVDRLLPMVYQMASSHQPPPPPPSQEAPTTPSAPQQQQEEPPQEEETTPRRSTRSASSEQPLEKFVHAAALAAHTAHSIPKLMLGPALVHLLNWDVFGTRVLFAGTAQELELTSEKRVISVVEKVCMKNNPLTDENISQLYKWLLGFGRFLQETSKLADTDIYMVAFHIPNASSNTIMYCNVVFDIVNKRVYRFFKVTKNVPVFDLYGRELTDQPVIVLDKGSMQPEGWPSIYIKNETKPKPKSRKKKKARRVQEPSDDEESSSEDESSEEEPQAQTTPQQAPMTPRQPVTPMTPLDTNDSRRGDTNSLADAIDMF